MNNRHDWHGLQKYTLNGRFFIVKRNKTLERGKKKASCKRFNDKKHGQIY